MLMGDLMEKENKNKIRTENDRCKLDQLLFYLVFIVSINPSQTDTQVYYPELTNKI